MYMCIVRDYRSLKSTKPTTISRLYKPREITINTW